MPQHLYERFEEARQDPDLLSVRNDLALMEARLTQLMERIDEGASEQCWRDLKERFGDLKRARRIHDKDAEEMALAKIEDTIERGERDTDTWEDVRKTIELKVKLSQAELKRLMAMNQILTVENAMTLLGRVVDAVKRHVQDEQALAAIGAEFSRMVDYRASAPTEYD